MGDRSRSPARDQHGIFGIQNISKAYKFLTGKRHHHDSKTSPRQDASESISKSVKAKKKEKKYIDDDDSSTKNFNHRRSVDDSCLTRSSSSFFSKTSSRRSHTPSPRPTYLSKSSSKKSSTPSPMSGLLRSISRRGTYSETEIPSPSSPMPSPSSAKGGNLTPKSSSSVKGGNVTPRSPSSAKGNVAEAEEKTDEINATSLSRNISRRSTTPIIFSQSQTTTRKKPSPIEKKLECTLEELCLGGVKKIKITKDVIIDPGVVIQQEDILRIKLKPGWRKGTKITFEGKGDEKPGYLPADIIFLIEEKKHPLFKRKGDDLEIAAEIPLVSALTGCSLAVPLLGGETMNIAVHDIIYHGYEKVIQGQGMPFPLEDGGVKRGDLRITFLVIFPNELTDEQKSETCKILEECF
ncbi:hypothetical protein ACFE04_023948 [Oxalis oulophora]